MQYIKNNVINSQANTIFVSVETLTYFILSLAAVFFLSVIAYTPTAHAIRLKIGRAHV